MVPFRCSRFAQCLLAGVVVLMIAGVAAGQSARPAEEKLPPSLEGRGLIRPAERAAAGLDPYPHLREPNTSTHVTATPGPEGRVVAANDAPTTATTKRLSREEMSARLDRIEAMTSTAMRDPKVRMRAAIMVDRQYPGPWSLEMRDRLIQREVQNTIRTGSDLKALDEIERRGEVMGRYVTLKVSDVPAGRVVEEMGRSGLAVALADALKEKMVTLDLDGVRGDLAVKRLAIELDAPLWQRPDGSWVIGDDDAARALAPDARRIAPLAEPTPSPAPTPNNP